MKSSGACNKVLALNGVSTGRLFVRVVMLQSSPRQVQLDLKEKIAQNNELSQKIAVLKEEMDQVRNELSKQTRPAISDFIKDVQVPKMLPEDLKGYLYRFQLTVLGAQSLRAMDLNGKSDPYCVVEFNDQRKQTPVIQETLSPCWKHDPFVFFVPGDSTLNEPFKFTILDWNRFMEHQEIGNCRIHANGIDLQNLPSEGNKSQGIIRSYLCPEGILEIHFSILKLTF